MNASGRAGPAARVRATPSSQAERAPGGAAQLAGRVESAFREMVRDGQAGLRGRDAVLGPAGERRQQPHRRLRVPPCRGQLRSCGRVLEGSGAGHVDDEGALPQGRDRLRLRDARGERRGGEPGGARAVDAGALHRPGGDLAGERLGAGGRAVHASGAPQRVVDRGHVRLLRAERQRVREPVRAPGSVFRGDRDHGNGDLRAPVRHCAPEPAHVHGASQRGEGRLCDFLGHGDGHRGGRRCGLERGGCQRARGGGGEARVCGAPGPHPRPDHQGGLCHVRRHGECGE